MEAQRRILVVDDDLANLRFLCEILEEDYNTLSVTTGEEALEAIEQFKPEIILLDIMLPGMSGYEVCQEVRNQEKFSDVKIVLVSAKAMANEKQEGFEAGADDYITKPFDHELLLEKIKIILN